jgi:uncharacterized LabA/DUF88 family protein
MRYCFYIDGFNVYHALNDYFEYKPNVPRKPENRVFPYRRYKWLNYRKLAESLMRSRDKITGIFFFTTYAKWKWDEDKGIGVRHRQYVKALQSEKIEVVQGRFMPREERCPNCRQYYPDHVEKRTDVNIALKVLGDAIDNLYDKAVIISADSDLLPTISAVRKYGTGKQVGIMFPIRRTSVDLRQYADFRFKMPEKLLKKSQFPDKFIVGGVTFERPNSWC